jgi:hypothetical protein
MAAMRKVSTVGELVDCLSEFDRDTLVTVIHGDCLDNDVYCTRTAALHVSDQNDNVSLIEVDSCLVPGAVEVVKLW